MRSLGKIFGLVPHDLQVPIIERARERVWNAGDECLLAPVIFADYTMNPKSASRHPFRALLVAVLILLRWRATRGN